MACIWADGVFSLMEMHDDFQRLRRAILGGALPPSTRKAPSSSATRSRDMCGNLQTSLKGLRRVTPNLNAYSIKLR